MSSKKFIFTVILSLGFASVMAQTTRGKATYYAKRMTGARTASGVRLHNDSMQCAHRTYPFGTWLRVRHLGNNKEVVVKVVDRGPFGKGLIIDLTTGAAEKLGMLRQGVATVEITPLKQKPPFRLEKEEVSLPHIEFDAHDYHKLPVVNLLEETQEEVVVPLKPTI